MFQPRSQSAARYYPSVQSAFQVWTLTRDHAAAMAVLNLIIEAEADSSEFWRWNKRGFPRLFTRRIARTRC